MDQLDEMIGKWVMEMRVAKGLSQSFLASQVHKDQSYISKIESGARRLAAVELFALAEALDLNSGEIAELYLRWCGINGMQIGSEDLRSEQ